MQSNPGIVRVFLVCSANVLFNVTAFLLTVFPSVLTNDLVIDLNFTPVQLSWMMSAKLAAALVFQLPAGMMINRLGARLTLSSAAALCAAGTFLFALATSPIVVIIAQFGIGIGVCFALVGSVNLYSTWLPRKSFASALGFTQAASMCFAPFGNLLIANMVELSGWRIAVAQLAIITLAVAVFLWLVVRKAPGTDLAADDPLTLKDVFRLAWKPQAWLLGCYEGFTYGAVLAVTGFWGITELERAYKLTLATATVLDDLVFVASALGAIAFGYYSDRIGIRAGLMRRASLLLAGCYVIMWIFPPPEMPLVGFSLALIAVGFLASTNVLAFATARDLFKAKEREVAAVFVNLVGSVLTIGLTSAVGVLLEWHSHSVPRQAIESSAIHYVFAINAVLIACGIGAVVVAALVTETHCKPSDPAEGA